MAVTAAMFGTWPEFILGGNATAPTTVINLRTSNGCSVALYTNSYSPSQDTQTAYNNTNEIATGNNYTQGGNNFTCTISTPSSRVVTVDSAADPTWATSVITNARRALVYDTDNSTDRVISWVDFGADVSSNNGDFKITWAAGGIFTITVAALA